MKQDGVYRRYGLRDEPEPLPPAPSWEGWESIEALILNELRFIRQHTAVYVEPRKSQ